MASINTETFVDLHTHTRGSDGLSSAGEIAEAAALAGLHAICLTDHHRTYTPESLAVARQCRSVGVVPIHGAEYSTAHGHLLVYGVDVETLNLGYYPDMQRVIDAVNEAGGVSIPSHPALGYRRLLGSDLFNLYDLAAIETLNGRCEYKYPQKNVWAVNAALYMGLPGTGGSDAHHASEIGAAYTAFADPVTDLCSLLEALRGGCYRPVNRVLQHWSDNCSVTPVERE